jgi:hypothetical protein
LIPPQQLDFSQGDTATVNLVQTNQMLELKIIYS